MKRALGPILILAVALAGFFFAGCASTEQDNLSERPWNTPKSWEHGLPTSIMRER